MFHTSLLCDNPSGCLSHSTHYRRLHYPICALCHTREGGDASLQSTAAVSGSLTPCRSWKHQLRRHLVRAVPVAFKHQPSSTSPTTSASVVAVAVVAARKQAPHRVRSSRASLSIRAGRGFKRWMRMQKLRYAACRIHTIRKGRLPSPI